MFRFDEGLNFSVTPNSLLKDISPGSFVAVGDVAPGGSVSHIWGMQGDTERPAPSQQVHPATEQALTPCLIL